MAALSLGYDRKTGKRRVIRRRAPDDKAADRALKRLQHEWGLAGEVAFVRLDDYLTDWLAVIEPTIAASTHVSYSGHVDNHISPLLGHLSVGSLRPTDVHRLIRRSLDDGASASTVGRIVTTLRMALQAAVRDGELTTNVAQVKLPRVTREPIEAMTAQRAQQILEAVKGDHLEALYVLLLGTGMRLGEACGLDWRDVDLGLSGSRVSSVSRAPGSRETTGAEPVRGAAQVFIRHGKTRSATRTIPLAPFVVRALAAHKAATPRYGASEPVFLGERTSERLRGSTVSHAFPRLMVAAGLPRLTVHALRHGTATLLLAKGLPMRDIADILGHANPSLTARVYAHTIQESRDRAARLLEEALG